ncbi:unnamed protein product [Cutaneotrichosporon oleaginosum]
MQATAPLLRLCSNALGALSHALILLSPNSTLFPAPRESLPPRALPCPCGSSVLLAPRTSFPPFPPQSTPSIRTPPILASSTSLFLSFILSSHLSSTSTVLFRPQPPKTPHFTFFITMKYFAAAAVLASVAVAQLDPSSVNPCILTCATQGATASGCSGVTDFACICSSQQFVQGALDCINAQCPDQVAAAQALQGQLCAGQGSASASASAPADSAAASSAAVSSASETAAAASSEQSAVQSSASGAVASASAVLSSVQSSASAAASSAASRASSVMSGASSAASAATSRAGAAAALTIPGKEIALAVMGAVAGAGLLL